MMYMQFFKQYSLSNSFNFNMSSTYFLNHFNTLVMLQSACFQLVNKLIMTSFTQLHDKKLTNIFITRLTKVLGQMILIHCKHSLLNLV